MYVCSLMLTILTFEQNCISVCNVNPVHSTHCPQTLADPWWNSWRCFPPHSWTCLSPAQWCWWKRLSGMFLLCRVKQLQFWHFPSHLFHLCATRSSSRWDRNQRRDRPQERRPSSGRMRRFLEETYGATSSNNWNHFITFFIIFQTSWSTGWCLNNWNLWI